MLVVNSSGKSITVMRVVSAFFLLVSSLVVSASAVVADTYVSGNITADTTWALSNSPYIIEGDMSVYGTDGPDGVTTLSIEPGVEVEFSGYYELRIGSGSVSGKLIADGDPGNPVVFTGNAVSPAAGDWRCIYFSDTSDDGSIIDNAIIEYGGYLNACNICLDSASPTISNSAVRNSSGYGIQLLGDSSPTLTGNILSNNALHPVSVPAAYAGFAGGGNTYYGNSPDKISVQAGDINIDSTWVDPGIPYESTGHIRVYGTDGGDGITTLTIEPGAEVQFPQYKTLEIGADGITGRLIADGEPGNVITFTRRAGDPDPWRCIYFSDVSDDGSIIDNAIIDYGGNLYSCNIYLESASPAISNSLIRNSSGYGIQFEGDSSPVLTGNVVSNNALHPVSVPAAYAGFVGGDSTYYGNNPDRIRVVGGTNLDVDATWVNPGIPYELTDTVYVCGPAGVDVTTLTIEPGTEVQIPRYESLIIGSGSNPGRLIADGEPGNMITFNRRAGDSVPWRCIYFSDVSDNGSIIDNAIIEYGGQYYACNIYINSASPTITNSVIRNTGGYGIRCYGAGSTPYIGCNRITGNTRGIHCEVDASPIIEDNMISGNSEYGVYNDSSSTTVNAEGNWWGDASGPAHPGNPAGTGDAVSDFVDYDPWLTAPPDCAVSYIRLEDFGGTEVGSYTMTTDDILEVYARAYDSEGGLLGDVPVEWSATGTLDPVSPGPGISLTFDPSLADTGGFIHATDGAGHTDSTGTVDVYHGIKVVIEINPDGASVSRGGLQAYTSAANDADGNSWDITGSTVFTTTDPGGSFTGNVYTAGDVEGDYTQTGTCDSLTDSAAVHVINDPPDADAGGPYSADEWAAVTFDAGGSGDINGDALEFRWDFENDGIWDTAWTSSPVAGHTYEDSGTWVAVVEVRDVPYNAVDSDTAGVTINNLAPVALAGGPYTIDEGQDVVLDGTGSYDPSPAGSIVAFTWDLDNDGQYDDAGGAAPAISWAVLAGMGLNDDGTYDISLEVADDDGAVNTDTSNLIINNLPPVADPNGPYAIDEGQDLVLDGTGSYDPSPAGSIVSFTWDLDNDGQYDDASGAMPAIPWTVLSSLGLNSDGSLNDIGLQVSDDDGSTDVGATTLSINDSEPAADFYADMTSGPAPLTVSFTDASTSFDGLTGWEWDFDDDGLYDESGVSSPVYTYTVAGTYTITLRVVELDGDNDTGMKVDYITVTATADNQPPEASENSYSTGEDDVTGGNVITDDTGNGADYDADGDILTVSAINGEAGYVGVQFTLPSNALLTVNPDGSFIYDPDGQFDYLQRRETGEDTFAYTIDDGNGGTDTATVTVTIAGANDAPVANDDSYSTDENTTLNISAPGILGNDTDAEGDSLRARRYSRPLHGRLTLSRDGSFTYTPDSGYDGLDSFTYYAYNGRSRSNIATVTITIGMGSSVNQPPEASENSYSTDEDNDIGGNVITDDTGSGVDYDADGDVLTVSAINGEAGYVGIPFMLPSNALLTVNPDGSFIYDPDGQFDYLQRRETGEDTFEYTIDDGNGGADTATVTVTIAGANDAPVANDDSYSTDENTALNISAPGLLGNDTDAEGDSLRARRYSRPLHGRLTLSRDGSFTYTPDSGYDGLDSFTYYADDGRSRSNIATVTITINPSSQPGVDGIDNYIQDLPDDAFDGRPDRRKDSISGMLDRVQSYIDDGRYWLAVFTLDYSVRPRMDGSLTPAWRWDDYNDWITDPQAQQDLCSMIDDLVEYLRTLM